MVTTPKATSAANTPQAVDDKFMLLEDSVTLLNGNILRLDVMANDAAGAAKQLWSIDDTNILQNLLGSDQRGLWEPTAGGNQMRIQNGQVEINLTNSLASYGGSVQGLGAGETITETFYYTIRLANGTLSVASADVTITGQNDAPVITSTARKVNFTEDSPAYIAVGRVTATDADVNDRLTYSGTTTNVWGTFTVQSDGRWNFQLDNSGTAVQGLAAGAVQTLTFPVTVSDRNGGTATQNVTVHITGTNDAPVVSDASELKGWVNEDTPNAEGGATVAKGRIIVTDADANAALTFTVADKTSGNRDYGTFSVDGSGNWTFTLDNTKSAVDSLKAGEKVTITYTVTVTDDKGATATQDVTITITGTNDAPVIGESTVSGDVVEDSEEPSISGTINATDVDHDYSLSFAATGGDTAYGSFVIDEETGEWTFTLDNDSDAVQALAEGETHKLTFTVTVTDDKGATATQDVTITITGTNDAPVITSSAQSGAVAEDGTPTATGTVTASDVDNGATQTYSGNATGTYGSFAVAADGKWTYTLDNANHQDLAAGETKTETFTVTVTDDKGATATQDVTVTITGTNDAPVITSSAQSGAVAEDGTLTATGTVTASDVDNGATQTYSGNATGTYGSFVVAADGKWTYTLDNANHQDLAAGETKTETFTVTVTDDKGATATQDVTITITGTNDAPVITSSAQSGAVAEDGTRTATGTVTASDVDNGATQTYSGNATGTYGSFAVAADGKWTYSLDNTNHQDLAAGETKTETFTVTVTDDKGATDTQDVTVTITGTNDAPVITSSAQSGAVAEDGTPTATGTVTASDVDHEATQTYSGNATGTYGSFAVAADGKWTYTLDNTNHQDLAAGETKTETFTVTVTDDKGATDTQDVTVTITGTNDAPVITSSAQSGAVAEDGTPTATGTVTASDVDHEATQTYSGNATGTYGSFVVAADGKWTYTLDNTKASVQALAQGETKTETFTVTVTDDKGATATQDVTVTITGTNDAPVFTTTAPSLSMTEDQLTVSGQVQASDVDGDTVSYGLFGMPNADKYNVISMNGNGTFSYTVNPSLVQSLQAGESDVETFGIVAYDTNGAIATQTVTVTINGVNDLATIGGTSTGSVTEDGTQTTGGTVTVADADHDQSVFATPASLSGTYGTFTFNASTGVWGYTLNNADTRVQALNTGSSLQDKLTVASLDGTASQDIVVTINGVTDNAPTNGADTLYGTDGANTISGGGGDDLIYGGGGADRLNGENNADTIYGGDGNDTIYGEEQSDVLYGGAGNDEIYGGNSGDTLYGGEGNDKLYGGQSADTFVFAAANNGNDTIYDFARGTDKIDLSAVYDNPLTPGDDVLTWSLGGARAAYSVWVSFNNGYFVNVDTDGVSMTSELVIRVEGGFAPASTDFIL